MHIAQQIYDAMILEDVDQVVELLGGLTTDEKIMLFSRTPKKGGLFWFKEKQQLKDMEQEFTDRVRALRDYIDDLRYAEIVDQSAVEEAIAELTPLEAKTMLRWR